jgi:hypothetical protein
MTKADSDTIRTSHTGDDINCTNMSISSDEKEILIVWRMRRRLKEETLDHFVEDDTRKALNFAISSIINHRERSVPQ